MSYLELPVFLWGYLLETAAYILNHVLSKSILKTPWELWNRCKPTLNHFRIWGCPAHMLKGKISKLETRSEVCYFIGYPKGTYGWHFYDPREQKVFVSTKTIFLEDDYIMNHKPKRRIVLEEVMGEASDSPIVNSNMEQENTITLPSSTSAPRPSGRIVREPDRFIFLGENL